ncbi:MAG: UDP-N-acetylglucosamine 2-epimerase (non-hydrolyzing) [bacterium]|nr:UDP-N-acetylglucosamine 2-epimerase (non-hydrolyzing) [bacterium]
MGDGMNRVLFVIGTRPEAIKLAPVILTMHEVSPDLAPLVVLTGQHPEMAGEALEIFDLIPDVQLEVLHGTNDLCMMVSRLTQAVGELLERYSPRAVVVQGDTLSALSAGMAAGLRQVPLAHVEAGLRTGCVTDPFPEELARRQLADLARWNFAPTREAEMNLLHEGIDSEQIERVGNTVVDALRMVRDRLDVTGTVESSSPGDHWTLLVTAHRRENWGPGLIRICRALKRLATQRPELRIVFSVHRNPKVREVVHRQLAGVHGVSLIDAPRYGEWVRLLLDCDAILTDSGGLQEEGTALGKPILVMRASTERPEALRAGAATIVGTETQDVVSSVLMLMDDQDTYAYMATPRDVFGDGYAAERIVARMAADLHDGAAPDHSPSVAVPIGSGAEYV